MPAARALIAVARVPQPSSKGQSPRLSPCFQACFLAYTRVIKYKKRSAVRFSSKQRFFYGRS